MSRQTYDQKTLDNVNRTNIKKDVYNSLQDRYAKAGIPTYSEFILGLPGETVKSFKKGIKEAIKTGTSIFIYHCTVLPNTEMANPKYIKKHGIKTVRVPMSEIHCEIRDPKAIVEYEDIVIGTNTMSTDDWINCAVYAFDQQLRHNFGITWIGPEEGQKLLDVAKGIVNGKPRGQIDLKFGNIYWEPEELAYLNLKYKHGNPIEFAKQEVLYGRKGK